VSEHRYDEGTSPADRPVECLLDLEIELGVRDVDECPIEDGPARCQAPTGVRGVYTTKLREALGTDVVICREVELFAIESKRGAE
jgi:hypothetical protein